VAVLIRESASLQLGFQLLGGPVDPFGPSGAVTQTGRDTIQPGIVRATRGGVLGSVSALGVGDHAGHAPVEPLLAAVGVDRGVRRDLGPVDRDRAEPTQARLGSDHQHLREQVGERISCLSPESGDRCVVGSVLSTQHPKRHVSDAHPLDLSRRPHTLAVRVDQQSQQHSRVVARSTSATATAGRPLQP